MKKTLVLIFALFALVACNLDIADVVETQAVNETDEIKLNITITRADISPDTKATVKSGWADGDVVFLFFNSVAAPKYVALKRAGSSWTARLKNNMEESDLDASGSMRAIYLPYGSTFTVAADEGSFTIKDADGNDYCGHFYTCGTTYSYTTDGGLVATISLVAAQPASGSDKLVHFDVSQYTAGHTYAMYQENMKPISLSSIAANGEVATAEGTVGDALPGYIDADNSIVSFSGVLESATGAKNWWFSIRDTEDGTLYFRDGGSKTVESNMYIGLGELTAWNVATPGEFSVSASKKVTFARSNLAYLGATGGTKPWQLQKYPWSTIYVGPTGTIFTPASDVDFDLLGFATSGHNGRNPWKCHPDPSSEYGPAYTSGTGGQQWYETTVGEEASYDWDWAVKNSIYECGSNTPLTGYRTPTQQELAYILNTRTGNRFVEATVGGIWGLIFFPDNFVNPGVNISNPNFVDTDHSQGFRPSSNTYDALAWNKLEAASVVFLPCPGYRGSTTGKMTNVSSYGGYWTSSVGDSNYAYQLCIDYNSSHDRIAVQGGLRGNGYCVRLVRDVE